MEPVMTLGTGVWPNHWCELWSLEHVEVWKSEHPLFRSALPNKQVNETATPSFGLDMTPRGRDGAYWRRGAGPLRDCRLHNNSTVQNCVRDSLSRGATWQTSSRDTGSGNKARGMRMTWCSCRPNEPKPIDNDRRTKHREITQTRALSRPLRKHHNTSVGSKMFSCFIGSTKYMQDYSSNQ